MNLLFLHRHSLLFVLFFRRLLPTFVPTATQAGAMTNQGDARGSSLFQAPSTANHNHNHDHNHVHNRDHLHFHHHRRLQTPGAGTSTPHIRSPPNKKLHDRQVVIVQTVSIVHYIDATGAVTSIQTLTPDPPQSTLDLPAAASAALTALDNALPSVSLPVSIPDLTDGAPSTTSSAESSSSASTSSETLTLTPTPFTSSSAFPTLSGVFNSSSSSSMSYRTVVPCLLAANRSGSTHTVPL